MFTHRNSPQLLLCSTNQQAKFTYVNHAFIEATGYDEEELLGHATEMVRHPQSACPLLDEMHRQIQQEMNWQWQGKLITKDKTTLLVHALISYSAKRYHFALQVLPEKS